MIWLLACLVEPEPEPLVELDYERFVEQVQPILGPRCSTPACHGDPGRPLQLYETGWHRAEEEDRFVDEPLLEHELWANFERSRAFVAWEPERSLLLTKPLAEEAGGVRHVVVIYEDSGEDEYQALLDWAEGGGP